MSDLQVQTTPPAIPLERELVERAAWFVRLRWLAGGATLVGTAMARWGLHIPIGSSAFLVGLVVLLYNVAFHLGTQRVRSHERAATRLLALVNLQILLDLLALTWLMHLSGGVVSPLRSFFVFHAIISSMLLRRGFAYLQATLAVGLVAGLAALEAVGWLMPQSGLPWRSETQEPAAVLVKVGFFAATQFVAVFLAQSISRTLRAKEERLVLMQRDLSEAYRQLEELDNAKSQFVLTVTHELRAPVAAIQSLLGVMSFTLGGELSEKGKDLLDRANRRVAALLHLVNDLLDVARDRHEFGSVEFRPVDLAEVLQNVRVAFQGRAEAKQMALEFAGLEASVPMTGDPEGLERLFGNLVGNAINYTNPGGQVRVRLNVVSNPPPGEVVVAVQDTGIGIPPESLRRLFEEFYRAPNAKKVLEHGTGLGLTICKRIVEEHQGRITVESEENVGSTFTVTLPLTPGQPPVNPD
jgi:signal transduction histidine kinase